jgi:hypothetical protein
VGCVRGLALSALLAAASGAAAGPSAARATAGTAAPGVRQLLRAMAAVESGHDPSAVGDGGRAIGPYQIHRAYWADAGVPGRWEYCREARYARRVVLAYWQRYCPGALRTGDAEILSRIHNGGPQGHRKPVTQRYWTKVQVGRRQAAPPAAQERHP